MIKFENISYSYPFCDQKALKNISFTIEEGTIALFTGHSGCGKSTLVRILNGLIPHYYEGNLSGKYYLNNQDAKDFTTEEHFSRTGTLFQDAETQYFTLQVKTEIDFGMELRNYSEEKKSQKREQLITEFNLKKVEDSNIFSLSEGEKQKVAMASVFAVDPKVIILDEPTANLDPHSTLELAKFLVSLKEKGYTIIVVDHRLYWLKDVANNVYVMKDGEIIHEGGYDSLDDRDFINKFSLRELEVSYNKPNLYQSETDQALLEIKNLSFAYKNKKNIFNDFNLSLPRGRVISITGENGVGKTTLGRLMAGLLKPKEGKFLINGQELKRKKLIKEVSIVQQNSDHQLFMKTVKEELLTSGFGKKDKRKEELANFYLEKFDLKEFENRHPQSLSGGQKQRLVIACGLMKEPKIIILDEPTSGLDGRNMKIIAEVLAKRAEEGMLILLISHDLELLNKISNYNLELK